MRTYEINLITMKKKAAVPSLNFNSTGKLNESTAKKSDGHSSF